MYEGSTVSYIIENPNNEEILYFGKNEQLKMITDPNKLLPFIPLSKDSDGGINSLFYNGNDARGDGTGEGDIFIDCAYTKFFLDMKKTGTTRYLQNIGGFIGSAERRYKIGEHPRAFRPDPVFYTLKKDIKFHYKYPIKSFDVVSVPIAFSRDKNMWHASIDNISFIVFAIALYTI